MRRSVHRRWALLLLMVWMSAFTSPVSAHLLNMTEARMNLDPVTGTAHLRLKIDLLRTLGSPEAYLALASNISNPDHQPLWQALADAIHLQQGDHRLTVRFAFAEPPVPLEPDAFADAFRWPRVWVNLTSESYDPTRPLKVTFTRDFIFEEPIALTITDGQARLSRWLITEQPSPVFHGSASSVVPADPGWAEHVAWFANAAWAGFRHILPGGIDHLMFVLALLLVCIRVRQTVLMVTAFTLGHSLSLAVAGFKLISVPGAIVEPLILLSIAVYALKALSRPEPPSPHHAWVVVGVGLLHGLGFAAAFAQLDWAASPLLSLLGFNLGIEVAQVIFVLLAFPLLSRYRETIRKPLAIVLLASSLLWLLRLAW